MKRTDDDGDWLDWKECQFSCSPATRNLLTSAWTSRKIIYFLCCLRERKRQHQQKIKHSTKRRWQAENPSELQLERFFFSGPMCMKMKTNWKESFCACARQQFFHSLSPPFKQFLYLTFTFVCFCCAHAFNGFVNVWEVKFIHIILNHELNVIHFLMCVMRLRTIAVFADDISINFAFCSKSCTAAL